MEKQLFQSVFNNIVLNNIIFINVRDHLVNYTKSGSNRYCKMYRWSHLLESPTLMIEYNYINQLKDYYHRHPEKVSLSNPNTTFFDDITKAYENDSLDILKFYMEELITDLSSYKDILPRVAKAQKWDTVRYIIQKFPNVEWNYNDTFIYSPLSCDLELVKLLSKLVGGQIISFGYVYYPCALDHASFIGRIDMIEWLIENRPAEECKTHRMYDYAVRGGQLNVIKYLVDKNFDYIQIPDPYYNEYPLNLVDLAVSFNQIDIVNYLLDNNDQHHLLDDKHDNEGVSTHLLDLAFNTDLRMLELLKLKGCTVELMNQAASKGRLDIIQWAHQNRTEGCTSDAMDNAARNGHIEVVKWLHENRTEGFTSGILPLAILQGHLDIVSFLFKIDPNRIQLTPDIFGTLFNNQQFGIFKWVHQNVIKMENSSQLFLQLARSIECSRTTLEFGYWLLKQMDLESIKAIFTTMAEDKVSYSIQYITIVEYFLCKSKEISQEEMDKILMKKLIHDLM